MDSCVLIDQPASCNAFISRVKLSLAQLNSGRLAQVRLLLLLIDLMGFGHVIGVWSFSLMWHSLLRPFSCQFWTHLDWLVDIFDFKNVKKKERVRELVVIDAAHSRRGLKGVNWLICDMLIIDEMSDCTVTGLRNPRLLRVAETTAWYGKCTNR